MDFNNEKFDIIVQGGQSNAEGSGSGPVDKELIPSDKVWYLNSKKTVEVVDDNLRIEFMDEPFSIEIAQERGAEDSKVGDFSLTFAEEYVKNGLLEEGRKLLIVRSAIGGAGFKKGQWGIDKMLYKKLREMTDYALSLNGENRIVAFLWHQGEHDAFEKNDPEVYKAQLTEQLQDFRANYGEKVPFIAGDFVSEWKNQNLDDCKPIVAKICEVVSENAPAAFVETADLPSNNEKHQNGDIIHFCRDSLHVLGRRYFNAFEKIRK